MNKENIAGYYQISQKERIYFSIRLVFSVLIYIGLCLGVYFYYMGDWAEIIKFIVLIIPFAIFFLIFLWLRNGFFVGLIKCFSIRITDKQLPEIYKTVIRMSNSLNIKREPKIYLLQAGGSLNAFAKKFFNSNYIVIYSDLMEAHFMGDKDAVEFVIAHELGHIKRNHFLKELLLAPSLFIPFLPQAYYRGCELTCDNIGKYFNQKGAVTGLMMLAGGKTIHKHLNVQEYIRQDLLDYGFWRWLVEKFLSHPNLYKRLGNVTDGLNYTQPKVEVKPTPIAEIENDEISETPKTDHSNYWPK